MITAGIDIGSLTAKCALMKDGELIAYRVIKVSPNLEETAEKVFQETLKAAGIGREEVDRVVATGYGRNKVGFADKKVTEISCHARGAIYFIPTARTVVDIGGQDSKVIAIENEKVAEFVMNDKCAAGTGRFLEVMAAALNLKVEELGDVAEKLQKPQKFPQHAPCLQSQRLSAILPQERGLRISLPESTRR